MVTVSEEINKGKEYRWKKRWYSGSRSIFSPNCISSTTKGKLERVSPCITYHLETSRGILILNPVDDLHIFALHTLVFYIWFCYSTQLMIYTSFLFFFLIYDILNTWNSGGLKWMQKLWFKTFGLQFIANQTRVKLLSDCCVMNGNLSSKKFPQKIKPTIVKGRRHSRNS